MLLGKSMPPPPPGSEEHQVIDRAMEKFAFDEEQMKLFYLSRDNHREAMIALNPKLQKASLAYYKEEKASPNIDDLFAEADKINDAIYKINKKHFEEVRAICTKEQLKNFDPFIASLLKTSLNREPDKNPAE